MRLFHFQPKPYRDRYAFFLCVLLLAIAALSLSYISAKRTYCAPEAEFTGFISAAEHTAAYPPGVALLVRSFERATGLAVNHYVYKGIMLALWLWAAYAAARYVLGKGWRCFCAVFIMLLNPYFVWTCLISPDTASECFFLFLSFYLLLRLHDRAGNAGCSRGRYCLLAFVLALCAVMRTTNFIILIFLLGVFCLAGQRKAKKYFFAALILFCLYTVLFCFYNYKHSQSFGLGTTFGINFFIGNHRAYLQGHPNYDIDVFFEQGVLSGMKRKIAGRSEAQQNAYFLEAGMAEIRRDVPAFFYRCIVKSLWHWLNFEKIPRLVAPGTHLGKDGKTIHTGGIEVLPSLLYVMYKLFYLPLFINALVLLFRRKLSLHEAVFFVPYVALWPVVVLLFPDTRFKLCAEVMAIIPMMRGVQYFFGWRQEAGGQKQDMGAPAMQ